MIILNLLLSIQAQALTLTPQIVIDQVLKQSQEIKEIEYEKKASETAYGKSLAPLEWNLSSEINFEDSKEVTLGALSNDRDRTLNLGFDLSKKIRSGTTFKLGYKRTSRDSSLNSFVTNLNPTFAEEQNLDNLYFEIEQELWSNAFGKSDRLNLAIGEKNSSKALLNKLESIEALVLSSLQAFWHSYIAKENLQASLELRKRYSELVKTVKSKRKLGYSNPGELSQAMAEFEDNEQKVKQHSADYLLKAKELFRLLNQKQPEEISFAIDQTIPPQPAEPVVDHKKLRASILSQLDVEIAEGSYESTVSSNHPKLNLVAKSSMTGVDESAQEAWSQVIGGNNPENYIGLSFQTAMFSRSEEAENTEAKYKAEKNKTTHRIVLQKLENEITETFRDVTAKRLIAESAVKSLKYREQAAKEVRKAFKQGRSDINNLIQVYNALSQTQTQKINAVGNYHIALNTLAALLDELIKGQK